MRHANSLSGWNPSAQRRPIVEANLSALQRDAQSQARSVSERNVGAEHDSARAYPVRGERLELPQLRLVGDCR